jgi:hypothetical protein
MPLHSYTADVTWGFGLANSRGVDDHVGILQLAQRRGYGVRLTTFA